MTVTGEPGRSKPNQTKGKQMRLCEHCRTENHHHGASCVKCKRTLPPLMTVTPIPGEPGRYLVQSESRPDVQHTVDLRYQEEPHSKPVPCCGCERMMAKHEKSCKHLRAVVEFESKNTNKI
jgi:hypothetical protein